MTSRPGAGTTMTIDVPALAIGDAPDMLAFSATVWCVSVGAPPELLVAQINALLPHAEWLRGAAALRERWGPGRPPVRSRDRADCGCQCCRTRPHQ